jgi:hypothetical protein
LVEINGGKKYRLLRSLYGAGTEKKDIIGTRC